MFLLFFVFKPFTGHGAAYGYNLYQIGTNWSKARHVMNK